MAYKPGQWLAICDRCGFQFLSGQMKKTWDGLYVDHACWEPRHPQEFIRGVPDEQATPWQRPAQVDINVSPFEYVEAAYWDRPAVVSAGSGATTTQDMYVERNAIADVLY